MFPFESVNSDTSHCNKSSSIHMTEKTVGKDKLKEEERTILFILYLLSKSKSKIILPFHRSF